MATMSAVMAKSLAFMKDQESDDNANIEIKDRVAIIESAVADLKSSLSDRNVDNKNTGYKPMVEEIKSPDVDAKPSETPVETENVAEAPVEEVAKPEGKSMSLTELKSIVEVLTKDVDELKKENADLKAIVEKPLQKSKGAENTEAKSQAVSPESKSKGPLDRIY